LGDLQILFTKDDNLFLIDSEIRLIKQVTNFVSGEEKPENKSKRQAKWLEEQQYQIL
jgi:hypothetical protein